MSGAAGCSKKNFQRSGLDTGKRTADYDIVITCSIACDVVRAFGRRTAAPVTRRRLDCIG